MVTPNRPASAMAFQESCGNSSVSSQWAARGASSRSATSRASLRSADCSSLSGTNCTPASLRWSPRAIRLEVEMNESRIRWPTWIGVICDDLETQRRFYRDALGFRETGGSGDWVHLEVPGGGLFELIQRDPSPQYEA